jgi:hypothetical protein
VTPPQIEVRNPEKETRVRKMLHDAGILSRNTWSAQESLDFDQEQKNLDAEAASATPPAGKQSRDASEHPAQMVESLEQKAWDPSEHPRGANSAAKLGEVHDAVTEIANLFSAATKIKVNPIIEIDTIAPTHKGQLHETPFIRIDEQRRAE